MKVPNLRMFKKLTKPHLIRAGLFTGITLIVAGTGTYVLLATKNTRTLYDDSVAVSRTKATSTMPVKTNSSPMQSANTKTDTSNDSSSPAATASPEVAQPTPTASPTPTFSFVDTSQWVTENSRDKSFSIKYISNLMYSTCPDLADNLMTAMAGPGDSAIDCGSLQGAVSLQPYNGHTDSLVLRTETAIAQTDDVWDRGGATPIMVTLSGGQTAQRYQYDSVILGKNYHTVEYDTTVGGKRYMAVDNWQVTEVPNTSVSDFDTMIQRTWIFN